MSGVPLYYYDGKKWQPGRMITRQGNDLIWTDAKGKRRTMHVKLAARCFRPRSGN